jgi:AraC family transcriptional regulator
MNERATRSDYAVRLERVLGWLAENLDDALDLTRLADVACMSPYHFHRIYHAMQGETVADTVRRLRLHRAAVELITGELPVPTVAQRAGYGSQAAFTRAFKSAYGVPPARYRASFVPAPRTGKMEDTMETTLSYQATIRTVPNIRVAALAHSGDYMTIGHAVTLHVGPYAELERPYKWLYGTWLTQSGEEAADAPCVEEYLNDARATPPTELKTEIWLPLR